MITQREKYLGLVVSLLFIIAIVIMAAAGISASMVTQDKSPELYTVCGTTVMKGQYDCIWVTPTPRE